MECLYRASPRIWGWLAPESWPWSLGQVQPLKQGPDSVFGPVRVLEKPVALPIESCYRKK